MSFKLSQIVLNSSKPLITRCSLNLTALVRGFGLPQGLSGCKPTTTLRRLLFPFPFITLTLPLAKCDRDPSCCNGNCNNNRCKDCGCRKKPAPFKVTKICPPRPCPPPPPPPPCCEESNPPPCDYGPTNAQSGYSTSENISSNAYFESQLDPQETVGSLLGLTGEQKPSPEDPIELTHEFLLKQACSVNADSVTRIISETISTLDDYHQQYRKMLEVCMDILQESRNDGTSKSQELLTCKMIVLRSQMNDLKSSVLEIETFLSSVEKLACAAAETAFLARAEYPSIALAERIQSALRQAQRIKAQTKELERDLIELQSVVIVESGNSLK